MNDDCDERYRKVVCESSKNNGINTKVANIPLFWVEFNRKLFKENGKAGSYMANTHPIIRKDEYVVQTINNLVDYIRDNYDMDEM